MNSPYKPYTTKAMEILIMDDKSQEEKMRLLTAFLIRSLIRGDRIKINQWFDNDVLITTVGTQILHAGVFEYEGILPYAPVSYEDVFMLLKKSKNLSLTKDVYK